MNDKADIIINILNTILKSDNVDQSITELSLIIEKVTSQTSPLQCEPCLCPSSQEPQLH